MLHRALALLAVLALVCFVAGPSRAADAPALEGTFVKVVDGKLTMTDKGSKEHTCIVAKDAKINCNDKECKLDDLKKGVTLMVTVEDKGEKAMATKIEAKTVEKK